jgi:hypothetical protein
VPAKEIHLLRSEERKGRFGGSLFHGDIVGRRLIRRPRPLSSLF